MITIDDHHRYVAADIELPRPTPRELRETLFEVAEGLDDVRSVATSLVALLTEEEATVDEVVTARDLLTEANSVADAFVYALSGHAMLPVRPEVQAHLRAAVNLLLGAEDLAYWLNSNEHWGDAS